MILTFRSYAKINHFYLLKLNYLDVNEKLNMSSLSSSVTKLEMKPLSLLNYFRSLVIVVILFLGPIELFSQEIAPIISFSSTEYGAENQNWDITQNLERFIYVANNEGLLEYNGARWRLYPSPNNTVIRSVASFDDRIYTGSSMEFGCWIKNDTGVLEYSSLSENIKADLFEDEIIWNIERFNSYVVFQSYDRIYFYNTETKELNFTADKKNNYRLFKVDQKLYIQKYDGRVLGLENGKEKLIAQIPENLNIKFLLSMFSVNDQLVVLTRTKGLYKIVNQTLIRWNISADSLLNKSRVFSGIQLKDKSFMMGTISNGVIVMSQDGQITNVVNQSKGLSNNTVLNLFEDKDGNVWTALDNGLDCLNMQSYIKEYNDKDGTVGTTYASIVHEEKLYVGTNQGLFYKNLNSDETLRFIKGTEGQVWSLYSAKDQLFCGHNSGVFLITDNEAVLMTDIAGVWNFRPIPNYPNKLLLGHYSGMAVLGKYGDNWKLDQKIKGFEISARFIEILDNGEIWVNHDNKGVYRLVLNKNLLSFDTIELRSKVPKGKGSGIIKAGNDLLYSHENGVFKLQMNSKEFIRDTTLSRLIPEGEYLSGKLVYDKKERLWNFNQNSIAYAQKGPLTNMVDIKLIPIENNWRKTTLSFENITHLSNNQYVLGKTNGYLLINLNQLKNKPHQIFLDQVKVKTKKNDFINVTKAAEGEFAYNESSISFSYNVPNYNKYTNVTFQYQLEGLHDSWSDWSEDPSVTFEKLPFGDYIFKVRSKIGKQESTNSAAYRFGIERPFYLSNIALLAYVLFAFGIGMLVHKSYKRYYRRQNEKIVLENQRQMQMQAIRSQQDMVQLKNEKLNQEIDSKNRELAISTMSLIKRNEMLRRVKKELRKDHDVIGKDHPVLKLIDKNLNSSKDKKFFMEAFNNADKEFLTRAREVHPNLSSNDLKFCAYLRLNLSSKEIAPLLNISVKSVEVRRSRLRKKLHLKRETNLIDYILAI